MSAVHRGDDVPAPESDPLRPTLMWRVCKMIARPIVTFGFDLKVHGAEHVPGRGGVLLVSNHQSYLDPIVLGAFLRRPMCYLAKSELFENKYFAWLIRSLNAFPVRQGVRCGGSQGNAQAPERRVDAHRLPRRIAHGRW